MTRIGNTIAYLRAAQAYRAAGGSVSYMTDPGWLVNMAVNRRAGWPDDPSEYRGSARPVGGRYPPKASGSRYANLRRLARQINRPRLIVRAGEIGEWSRLLLRRCPDRFGED